MKFPASPVTVYEFFLSYFLGALYPGAQEEQEDQTAMQAFLRLTFFITRPVLGDSTTRNMTISWPSSASTSK